MGERCHLGLFEIRLPSYGSRLEICVAIALRHFMACFDSCGVVDILEWTEQVKEEMMVVDKP